MPPNRNKLTILKQKIINLQHELTHMQDTQKQLQKSIQKGRNYMKTPQRLQSGSYSRQHKSPSYLLKTNPITFSQKYAKKRQSSISPQKSTRRTTTRRQISPELKDIMNTIDKSYYRSLESSEERQRQISPVRQTISPTQHKYTGRRYQFSQYGTKSYFPNTKDSKKKTYKSKKKDPVLDPEEYKEAGVKIVNSKEKAPQNPYTRHPQSKDTLFCYQRPDQTVFLQRKGNLKQQTLSNILLSSSLGQIIPIKFDTTPRPKRKRSQRKHFTKFFDQFYNNQLTLD